MRCIRKSVEFAGDEGLTIYINPSDQEMKEELELSPAPMLTISNEDSSEESGQSSAAEIF